MILSIPKILVFFGLSYTTLSLAEWFLHKYFMHRRTLRVLHAYLPVLRSTYYNHGVQHHATFYKDFNYEPDPIGRYISIYPDLVLTPLLAAPVVIMLWFFSPLFLALRL
jgi:hypothetical protein